MCCYIVLCACVVLFSSLVFFFKDTATTEIYTYVHTLSYTTLFRSDQPQDSGPERQRAERSDHDAHHRPAFAVCRRCFKHLSYDTLHNGPRPNDSVTIVTEPL